MNKHYTHYNEEKLTEVEFLVYRLLVRKWISKHYVFSSIFWYINSAQNTPWINGLHLTFLLPWNIRYIWLLARSINLSLSMQRHVNQSWDESVIHHIKLEEKRLQIYAGLVVIMHHHLLLYVQYTSSSFTSNYGLHRHLTWSLFRCPAVYKQNINSVIMQNIIYLNEDAYLCMYVSILNLILGAMQY